MSTARRPGMTAFASLVLLASVALAEDLKPALPFTDNMVLQRDVPAPVWGTAPAGQQMTVRIGSQTKAATADKDGKWMVKLDALPAGGPLEMRIDGGEASVTIRNVLVGEVWLCSGQSNMVWRVSGAANAAEEIAEANYPQVRMMTGTASPWSVCSPQTVGTFSATGYYFGRELHKALQVPVGLITEAVGGTSARLWTPRSAIEAVPELAPILEAHRKAEQDFPAALARYEQQHRLWEANRVGREPAKPVLRAPGHLYDTMIQPVVPYGIRGAIWYQGESDAGIAALYHTLFATMIRTWRQAWGQGEFPFLYVQLPNYGRAGPGTWAVLREQQARTLALPNTGMAVTIDVGEPNDIHPKNKQDVGRRLALVALAKVYGKDVVCSGPVYDSFAVEGDKVRVRYKGVHGGLEARGGELKGFVIAGQDKQFHPARAKIDGQTVVVWSEAVPKPASVRYAWENNPEATLYNKEGLPAGPFRTDTWP